MEPASHIAKRVIPRDAIMTILVVSLMAVVPTQASSFFTITNTSWRMFKGTNEASLPDTTAWRLRTFDDSSWTIALAPIFYSTAPTEPPFYDGTSTNNTVLTDMQYKYSTVFFRKTFVVSNAAAMALLNLDAVCDDGLVVWLNGAEILRVNVPAGELPYNTLALISRTEPLPIVTYTITNVPGLLIEGMNVMAVQGLNRSLDSSDFGFMAGLASAIDDVPPTVTDLMPPAGSSVQSLTQIIVQFSEPVTNLNPADLLMNGVGANGLLNVAPNRFQFSFSQPQTGTVSVIWATTNQITDLASNAFTGGSWSYQLDTNVFAGAAEITEFMADNSKTLLDEDGDSSDWIEIHNPGPTPVALDGWFLTDKKSNLRKWRIPATNLVVNGYLVVFASGKDRSVPGAPLHMNFKLASAGGYLALVRPDGTSVASEFSYGQQRTDISFGISRELDATPLVATGSLARVIVPSNNTLGFEWTGGSDPFDDSGWVSATNAIGFDQSSGGIGLTPIGFWDFDNAANPSVALDQSGHNHLGTLHGPAFTGSGGGRTGLAGDRAMNFGPVNNGAFISVADGAAGMFDMATANNQITFSLWIFGDASEPGINSVFWGADASGGAAFNAHLPWEDSVIYWDTGGFAVNQRVSILEPDTTKYRGKWNHYVFLKNGTLKQIWQNGTKILEVQNATYPLQPVRSLYIGSNNGGVYSYGGLIDDFAVWGTSLAPEQIQILASGGSPLSLQSLKSFFATDIGALMRSNNASAYVRIPFVAASTNFDLLLLRMRYDDGFVCWINGVEVARRNAPNPLEFDSSALVERQKSASQAEEEIDLSAFISLLHPGGNVFALQGLNFGASDEEFIVSPFLISGRHAGEQYFPTPTPGAANGQGVLGFVADLNLSTERGYYFGPTNTTLTCATPGAAIVYTLDGSPPSPTNGMVANAPATNLGAAVTLTITNNTLLRAAAFKPGFLAADAETHSYLFPAQFAKQTRPGWLPATWPDASLADFDVDGRVVTNANSGYSFTNALISLPAISIVTTSNDLFSPATGIYANALGAGPSWDRAGSAEMFFPDQPGGFHINCGIRIHGGVSRYNSFTPKHSFSLLFQSQFGPTKLDFPLFTTSTAQSFDELVLRGCSTDSWPVEPGASLNGEPYPRWTRDEASYMRDQWMRDAQLAMNHPSSHGRYVQLYLDGLYWGLYNIVEHTDESFAATYLGGAKDEYDVVADFGELHAGTLDAWNQMVAMAQSGLDTMAAYQRIQGNNPDGTRNTNYPVYLKLGNFVDYILLHVFSGADDWPDHNWWAARRRGPDSTGFHFFTWDQEITNNSLQRQRTSWSPFPLYADVNANNTPGILFAQLKKNAEFRQVFADRVQKHLFNTGVLTVSSNIVRWQLRHDEIDHAIVGESARWGDYQRPASPYRREVEWVSNQTWMVTTYFPANLTNAMARFRNAGLFPSLAPPTFNQLGGNVPQGFAVALSHTNAAGLIYFTLDGTDPRQVGGAISTAAQLYSQPIPLTSPTLVRVRVQSGTVWSALVEAQFYTPQDFTKLQLSEIMYNPPSLGTNSGDAFEFIELRNVGADTLDLSGLMFTNGITFTFSNETLLAPGAYFVIGRDASAFPLAYPGASLNGLFTGKLNNSGETLTLSHPLGGTILSVHYNNESPWTTEADNTGLSLQRTSTLPNATNTWNWVAAPPTPGSGPLADFVDSDGDGLPDAWENFYGLNAADAGDVNDDADHDGMTNLQEFLAGTNPRDDDDVLKLRVFPLATTLNMASVRIGFTAISNKTYTIQFSETLTPGAWTNLLQIDAAGSNRWFEVTNSATLGSRRSYRVATPRQR